MKRAVAFLAEPSRFAIVAYCALLLLVGGASLLFVRDRDLAQQRAAQAQIQAVSRTTCERVNSVVSVLQDAIRDAPAPSTESGRRLFDGINALRVDQHCDHPEP